MADGFTVLGGEWEVVNGTYHAHTQGFEFWGISLAGSAEWGDYHFECDLYTEGSVNQVVWFRMFSPLHYYELVVRADPWNDAFLNKMINGNKVLLAYDPYYPNSPETWHHIPINVIANEIMARFDEDLLFDINDFSSPYLQGHIALASYSGGVIQWQDVFFDRCSGWTRLFGCIVLVQGIRACDSLGHDLDRVTELVDHDHGLGNLFARFLGSLAFGLGLTLGLLLLLLLEFLAAFLVGVLGSRQRFRLS